MKKPFPIYFVGSLIFLVFACGRVQPSIEEASGNFAKDSLKVEQLLDKGDEIYASRSQMNTIAESLLYFDSANNMARRLGDTMLMARTLYFIGNVYNAWNNEPDTTIAYYSKSLELLNSQPGFNLRKYYLRYILAHAYDGDKGNDSVKCVSTLNESFTALKKLSPEQLNQLKFLSDFAWVAANIHNYNLAEKFLDTFANRSLIINDPTSNNYLDHYYLTKARIDVYGKGKYNSPYLDSLEYAFEHCNNRFDSSYLSTHLANLYKHSGNYKKALFYSDQNIEIIKNMGQSDILSALRQELLRRQVEAEKEKQSRISSELKNRNIVLLTSVLILSMLGVIIYFSGKRKMALAEKNRQQEFTKKMFEKAEEVRRSIAADLHDGINHELLAIKNNLTLHKTVQPDDVEKVISSVRQVSRDIFPVMFETVGLEGNVKALCERMTNAGFFTTCDIDYSVPLNKDDELQVYRIIQEAINNITKHANAEASKITIVSNQSKLFVEIKDNGKGISAFNMQKFHDSYGMESMRQRARIIGAELSIYSNGIGTVVTLTRQY